ncbi:AAA family ATPase, partial [Escherichia coli]
MSSTAITCVAPRIPVARMRSIYRLEEVSKRLDKLPPK